MIDYEAAVKAFQIKYRHFQPPPGEPTFDIRSDIKDLRMRLIHEEFDEMLTGYAQGDLVEFADGAADLIYVLIGSCTAFGIPINRVFQEVHRSNMTKTVPEGDGSGGTKYAVKTPKGKDYIPPDIFGILFHSNRQTKLEEIADGIS